MKRTRSEPKSYRGEQPADCLLSRWVKWHGPTRLVGTERPANRESPPLVVCGGIMTFVAMMVAWVVVDPGVWPRALLMALPSVIGFGFAVKWLRRTRRYVRTLVVDVGTKQAELRVRTPWGEQTLVKPLAEVDLVVQPAAVRHASGWAAFRFHRERIWVGAAWFSRERFFVIDWDHDVERLQARLRVMRERLGREFVESRDEIEIRWLANLHTDYLGGRD